MKLIKLTAISAAVLASSAALAAEPVIVVDGNEAVVESWKYEGCFLQSVDWGDVDYSTGEKMTISLTVRYDHARQVLVSAVTGSAIGGLING